MLTLAYAQDYEYLQETYSVLGIALPPVGCNFLYLDDGKAVGLIRLIFVDGVATVDTVKFADGVEDGDKLFFIHATFYKLKIGAPVRLKFRGRHEELKPYGFEIDGEDTSVITSEINLHGNCKGKC